MITIRKFSQLLTITQNARSTNEFHYREQQCMIECNTDQIPKYNVTL